MKDAVRFLLERSWVVVVVPALTLYVGAVVLGLFGTVLAVETAVKAFRTPDGRDMTVLGPNVFSVIDVYLLAMVLYLFAIGLYSLFVAELDVPEWLKIRTVDELKAKLASVVVLFVAIAYVKVLVDWRNPLETLLFGVSTVLLMFALIHYYKAKEHA